METRIGGNGMDPSTAIREEQRKDPVHNVWALSYLVVFANLGSVLFGFELGATIWLMYIFSNYGTSDDDSTEFGYIRYAYNNDFIYGLIASAASLGAVLCYGGLLIFADNISKKNEIFLAATFYFMASLLVSISSEISWNTAAPLVLLIVGRFMYGIGIATTLHSIPQYITEVLPLSVRGSYGSSVELMVILGMNVGFAAGYINKLLGNNGWTWTFRFAYIFALIMAVCSFFIPHNPIWLVYNDKSDGEILAALRFITPDADESNVAQLKETAQSERRQKIIINERLELYRHENPDLWVLRWGIYDLLTPTLKLVTHDRLYRRCLLIKLVFNLLKIFTGQTVFLYFAFSIFQDFSISSPEYYVLGYLAARLLSAYIMLWIGDLQGRRVFLLLSAAIMAVALYLAAISYEVSSIREIAVAFIFMSGIGFQLGFGSMAYFVLNEITPFYIRSAANAIANMVLFSAYFAVTFLFPLALSYLGFQTIFFFFALCNTAGLYFVLFYIPETRGVELEKCYHLVDEMCDRAPTLSCLCRALGCDCGGCASNDHNDRDTGDDALCGLCVKRSPTKTHVMDEEMTAAENKSLLSKYAS